ncbi:MAG: hypothetical protein MAG795_00449 [Candidatus Woesearchaeota archaeon]|nr:hypothetical protein [Candidatus Woesearchaeota archaeon]
MKSHTIEKISDSDNKKSSDLERMCFLTNHIDTHANPSICEWTFKKERYLQDIDYELYASGYLSGVY